MTRRKGRGPIGGRGPVVEEEGPRFVLGSQHKSDTAAPATLDERFKQLAEQREKAKSAGSAIRRAEAADRATQSRYATLTAKRKGAVVAPVEANHAAALAVAPKAVRGGGSHGRGRGSAGKKGTVRRKDGAAAVAAGFGLALPRRPGIAARRAARGASRLGRGERPVRGAAIAARGRGRGNVAGKGRGSGRGRGAPAPSAEQLNSDLDAYFSEVKK